MISAKGFDHGIHFPRFLSNSDQFEFLRMAMAVVYAACTVSLLRLRSWKNRHRIVFRVVDVNEIQGIQDLGYTEKDVAELDCDEASEIDSLLSPFSRDIVFGVEVNGEIVGVDTVRIDGAAGYVGEVKLAEPFKGHGLEHALRKYCLANIRRLSQNSIQHIRHVAFGWNVASCNISLDAGMKTLDSWQYTLSDDVSFSQKRASKVALAKQLEFGITDRDVDLEQVVQLDKVEERLSNCSDSRILLQYWDVYDLSSKTIRLLFAPVDQADQNEFFDATDYAQQSNRNCCMRAGSVTCSVGELIGREEPLGSLCAFTIYCSRLTFEKHPKLCIAQALAHAAFWTSLAEKRDCHSIAFFVSCCLKESMESAMVSTTLELQVFEAEVK